MTSRGSLAMLAAMHRASSRVSSLALTGARFFLGNDYQARLRAYAAARQAVNIYVNSDAPPPRRA